MISIRRLQLGSALRVPALCAAPPGSWPGRPRDAPVPSRGSCGRISFWPSTVVTSRG